MTSRILLVDDNATQAGTRKAILESCGQVVQVALHGKEALTVLQGSADGAPFGLVITDHLMPVMSGPVFVSELRRQGYDLPVIVLSGLPDAETAYEDLDVVFRLKPYDPAMLIQLAQELMGNGMRRSA